MSAEVLSSVVSFSSVRGRSFQFAGCSLNSTSNAIENTEPREVTATKVLRSGDTENVVYSGSAVSLVATVEELPLLAVS